MTKTVGTTGPIGLRQELRLGVVMTGGVSLAIWMGGVARELNLLLAQGEPKTEPARQVRAQYRKLLDLLDVDVSVDVLSGTSAGGINAAILGLANVRNADIGSLRDLWMTEGSLLSLLREPKPRNGPIRSLLKGDERLLLGLRKGFRQIATGSDAEDQPVADAPEETARPTELFITTTLLDGLPSRFVDDYGTVVADRDHHGLFHFTERDLRSGNAPDQLALAGRCTASFPGAFEAAKLPVGADSDTTHPDMAGLVNTFSTTYVADGGILANRPIAAAVRAVFDRPAGDEVRRLLLYVVPTADDPAASGSAAGTEPLLGRTLLKDLGAATSQAITGDLAGIRAHNERVRVRRDTRGLLAGLAAGPALVTPPMWAEYRLRTADRIARELVDALLRRVEPARIPLANTDAESNGQAPLESRVNKLIECIRNAVLAGPTEWEDETPLPLPDLGLHAAAGAMTIALQLLNSSYGARPNLEIREQLATARQRIHNALPPTMEATDVDKIVAGLLDGDLPPDRVPSLDLDSLAALLSRAWMAAQPARAVLEAAWAGIAGELSQWLSTLRQLVGPSDLLAFVERNVVDGSNPVEGVGQGLAQMHIAETVLLPDEPTVEQPLALVQVSADTATALDPARSSAALKLTGLQFHHFGAFYKSSWRANDWMWGRLDGAGWLVHILLDPQRILARHDLDPDPAQFVRRFHTTLADIAGSPMPEDVRSELQFLDQQVNSGPAVDSTTPTSLPRTAIWVAAGLQRLIVGEELPCVAEQIRKDEKVGVPIRAEAQAFLDVSANGDPAAWLQSCRVSTETFAGEANTRLLRSTVAQAAAVTGAAVAESGSLPRPLKRRMNRVVRVLRWNLFFARHGINAPEGWALKRVFPGHKAQEGEPTGPAD